jgi:type VI secretion system protein ImpF
MATEGTQPTILPSILDRLIDAESGGTVARQGYSVQQLIDVVRRDLEELLNTRQSVLDLPKDLKRTADSIHAYGMKDLTSFNAVTPEQREDVARAMEATVARHEPRLRDIRATLLSDEDDLKQRRIRFRIEGRVAVDPAPEVAFDTLLELTSGQHSVQQSAT